MANFPVAHHWIEQRQPDVVVALLGTRTVVAGESDRSGAIRRELAS
jgi:hypothetical protein